MDIYAATNKILNLTWELKVKRLKEKYIEKSKFFKENQNVNNKKMYLVKHNPLGILIAVEATMFFLSMTISKAIELVDQRTPSWIYLGKTWKHQHCRNIYIFIHLNKHMFHGTVLLYKLKMIILYLDQNEGLRTDDHLQCFYTLWYTI